MEMGISLFGRVLIGIGLFFILLGTIFMLGARITWFGRLPGDVFIQRKNFTLYFPIVTSIILSSVLSLIFWFFSRRIK